MQGAWDRSRSPRGRVGSVSRFVPQERIHGIAAKFRFCLQLDLFFLSPFFSACMRYPKRNGNSRRAWPPPARLFCGGCGQKPRGESINMAAVMDSHVNAHHKHESSLARPRNCEGNQLTRPRLWGLQYNPRSTLSYIPLLICTSLYCHPLPVRARAA